ncbi:MAG: hypothetical protein KatS3mg108_3225 [Isosphaeraceae bacterium]|nr:MAG: hypothetical protein KatS3mg108_3225 [Isosphaeraceae bacterium]
MPPTVRAGVVEGRRGLMADAVVAPGRIRLAGLGRMGYGGVAWRGRRCPAADDPPTGHRQEKGWGREA